MFLLIIPFLIKPTNGLYDIGELEKIKAYCFIHADRAAQGENVVNDLIKSGLANSTFYDWSCQKVDATLQTERQAESEREVTFANHCRDGNLTPSQYRECDDGGYSPGGTLCLLEEDREEAKQLISEGGGLGYSGQQLDFDKPLDLSLAEPLTPAERLECENAGYEPGHLVDEDDDD